MEDVDLTDAVPAELGQLTSLEMLNLTGNQLTSLPAEIGQLTSLTELYLDMINVTSVPAEPLHVARGWSLIDNQLTSVPAAIRDLRAAGCRVYLDDDRCSGHGVRCALHCRRGGRRTSNRRIGTG